MLKKSAILIAAMALFITYLAFSPKAEAENNLNLFYTSLIGGLSDPVAIANSGIADDDRLFIAEQSAARIRIYDLGSAQLLATPFLDINSIVGSGGEQGLLGLAFHPNYESNGYFYVHYTDNSGDTVVARYTVTGDANVADPDSASVIFTLDQPYSNHNGGDIHFGDDGYLYISLGDGGSGGDPDNYGQNPNSLLGTIMRIDVDGGGQAPNEACAETENYTVPVDNPFVGQSGCDEIWVWGLRNPWRFSFDRKNGNMYIADVGQGSWEEINFLSSNATAGVNFGWRCYEGNHAYNTSGCDDPSNYAFPVAEYNHDFPPSGQGGCSVTGGYVYRGSSFPNLYGRYIYTDYCSGVTYVLKRENGQWINEYEGVKQTNITSYGEDVDGELYAVSIGSDSLYQVAGSPVSEYSLQFFGNGTDDIDRIKVPIDGPETAADVGTDFTIEWWMKVNDPDISTNSCTGAADDWIQGKIILDRDIAGTPPSGGDYGISLMEGKIAFGVHNGTEGLTLCANSNIADGDWHHVAVTREAATGAMHLYIDGGLDIFHSSGPTGDISYPDDLPTSFPNSDPFLVIGAEKQDLDPSTYPSYYGLLDELRISDDIRYTGSFTPSSVSFSPDANTVLLLHFDEGEGNTAVDSSGNVNGEINYGGIPGGPLYQLQSPFSSITPLPENRYFTSMYNKGGENRDDRIVLYNPEGGSTANIDIVVAENLETSISLEPGESYNNFFEGLNAGPVEINSDNEIFAFLKSKSASTPDEYALIKNQSLLSENYIVNYINDGNKRKDRILVGNPSNLYYANVEFYLEGELIGTLDVPAAEKRGISFPSTNGIIKLISNTPVYTLHRSVTNNISSDYPGIPAQTLTTDYFMVKYVNNARRTDRVIIGNPYENSSVDVDVYIDDSLAGSYTLQPSERRNLLYTSGEKGMVSIEATGKILAVHRSTKKNASSEYNAIPANIPTNEYFFSNYVNNLTTRKDSLQVGNIGIDPITIEVYINDELIDTDTIPAESMRAYSYQSGGLPVRIVSGDVFIASMRYIYNGYANEYPGNYYN